MYHIKVDFSFLEQENRSVWWAKIKILFELEIPFYLKHVVVNARFSRSLMH